MVVVGRVFRCVGVHDGSVSLSGNRRVSDRVVVRGSVGDVGIAPSTAIDRCGIQNTRDPEPVATLMLFNALVLFSLQALCPQIAQRAV